LDHAHIVLAQVETAVMGMCEQPFQPPLRIASRRVRPVPFLEQRHLPIQIHSRSCDLAMPGSPAITVCLPTAMRPNQTQQM
jgi:hypothetical protein